MADISIGIVGLPNVGKSTLFNALTNKSVLAANYPFATIDSSVGVVAVPDERVDKLAEFSQSEKKIPAAIEFVDIAGLVKGASEGEGLGNQFLSHIREVSAIAQVVRVFDNPSILHVDERVDPVSDIETINLELVLADIDVVEKRLATLDRNIKRILSQPSALKDAQLELLAVQKAHEMLLQGKSAQTADFTSQERMAIKGLHLLTMKPMLYVLNRESGGHNLDEVSDGRWEKLMELLQHVQNPEVKPPEKNYVVVDANVESELRELSQDDKVTFRREYGVFDDGISDLIRAGYALLGLISFFTTGADETRAWTIEVGSTAPVAGAAIHTDFKDTFIRAEVIEWQKLLEAGSYTKARELGQVRTEGKEYIVQDGDVIEFLHG